MNRGELWSERGMVKGVWLEAPRITGFVFQGEDGVLYKFGPIKKLTDHGSNQGFTWWMLKDVDGYGKRYDLIQTEAI